MTDTKYHYHDFGASEKLKALIKNTPANKEIQIIPMTGGGFVGITRPDPRDNQPVLDAIQHLEWALREQSEDHAMRQAVNLGTAIHDLQSTIIKAAGVVSLMLAGVIVVLLI